MSPNLAGLPQRYLRTPEAAWFVGLSIRTLEKHRIYGTGPRYSKLGGRVVYSPCLDATLPPSQDTPGIPMLSTQVSMPPARLQASIPPWMCRAAQSPTSCAARTAMAERSPKAQ
jgi:hypothetical protein